MPLVLTILSVLAAWALLAVLIVGLLLIYKPLISTRISLQKIAMGVRAIEKEVAPLGSHVETLGERLPELNRDLNATVGHLTGVARSLEVIVPGLRKH